MPRKPPGIELNKDEGSTKPPSIFDKLVSEVVATEIPAKYIEYITVIYKNGQTVHLSGTELTHPIPIDTSTSWDKMKGSFAKIKDVRVYIDTEILGNDVTSRVDTLLDKFLSY